MADDGNKGRSSPFAGLFGAIGSAVSPVADRKASENEGGQDKPAFLSRGVIKPKAVVATDAKGALEKAPSEDKGGEKKKGFLGLWGGRRRRKSRRKSRRRRRKSRRRRR